LYGKVEIGTPVRIVNQPYLFGRVGDDLVFEAHRPLDDDERDLRAGLVQRARAGLVEHAAEVVSLDEQRIARLADDARGFPVSVISWRPDTAATVRDARRVINIIEPERVAERVLVD
jgi:L,D-transpeptidase ErfK/SrfK